MIDLLNIKEEVLLKSVLDTVDDGVTIIDKNLNVIFHNEAIRKNFGDIKGRLCYEAFRGRVEPCVDCLILKVLKDGKQRKVLSDTVGPKGQVMWMECAAGPLKEMKGTSFSYPLIQFITTKQPNPLLTVIYQHVNFLDI
jgi:transcriptional regulator with PAS, ATPase and Fis domain